MAFTYGFYNYDINDLGDSKIYDAQQMSQLFDGIITDGVYAHVGSKFMVTATSTGVKVGSGRAWFVHTWNYNDSDFFLDAPVAPTTDSRIDAVIIEINANKNTRANTIKWKLGTEAASPVRPGMTHSGLLNQYALAYVTRTAGVATIVDNQIANAVGTDETPYVTGVLETISASQILSEFEREFAVFKYQKNIEFSSFLDIKESEFTAYLKARTFEFNSFINGKNSDYNNFVEDCQTQFNNFLSTTIEPECREYIKSYSLVSEGHASGTQDGNPVGSSSPYYHKNAKYYSEQAASSATNAATSETNAAASEANAATSESNAASSASDASDSAILAESYAKGGTNTRTGENTDNAEYYKDLAKTYSENAEAVVGIGIATTERAGIVKPDGETIDVDESGKIMVKNISSTVTSGSNELITSGGVYSYVDTMITQALNASY